MCFDSGLYKELDLTRYDLDNARKEIERLRQENAVAAAIMRDVLDNKLSKNQMRGWLKRRKNVV